MRLTLREQELTLHKSMLACDMCSRALEPNKIRAHGLDLLGFSLIGGLIQHWRPRSLIGKVDAKSVKVFHEMQIKSFETFCDIFNHLESAEVLAIRYLNETNVLEFSS